MRQYGACQTMKKRMRSFKKELKRVPVIRGNDERESLRFGPLCLRCHGIHIEQIEHMDEIAVFPGNICRIRGYCHVYPAFGEILLHF